MKRPLSLFLLLTILLSFSVTILAQEKEKSEYRISVNDVLEISVYEEPDLKKTVRVAADGTISYPLLGNILVRGFTAKEVEDKITDMLMQDYLVNPSVSVFIKAYSKISVLGQVRNPGSYELKTGLTVLDAIALSGSFTDQANAGDVRLVRTKGDEKVTINIDANEIIQTGSREKDIALEPGDVVIVGELSESTEFVVVLGQVRSPGKFSFKKGMTVVDAIALSGGLTEIAGANGTKVIRREDDKEVTIQIPLGSILKGADRRRNVILKPGDTIVVPESFF